jgi:mevalonate kinase
MKAEGRASGKVILLGEHAVVYGKPALAAGIAQGARAEAERLADGQPSRLDLGAGLPADDRGLGARAPNTLPPPNPPGLTDVEHEIARAFVALLGDGDPPLPPVAVTAALDLPPGAGLGSSAAAGVAIARAVLAAAGRPAPDPVVIARATAWEKVFHGNPSGIDTTAAAIGGCFRFSRSEGVRPLALPRDLVLCVGLSGVSTSTREMVEGLARLREKWPDRVDQSISAIGALVDNAVLAIEAGDLEALGKLMDLNQMLLAGLMLSTEGLETLCAVARRAGALGAKLTGKGGGGSVLALCADERGTEEVLAAWRAAGYEGFATRVPAGTQGCPGISGSHAP